MALHHFKKKASIFDDHNSSTSFTSNKKDIKLARLEKLRAIARPDLSVPWPQQQIDTINEAEDTIQSEMKEVSGKKLRLRNLKKIRTDKGV